MPGDGDSDETIPSFIIHHHPYNSRNSIRSALHSPDLFDRAGFRVAEEDEYDHDDDDDDDGVNEGRKEDEEAAVVSRVGVMLSEEPEEIIEAQEQQEEGVRAVKGEEVSEATKMIFGDEEKGKLSKK